jgi:hypothetical protein
MPVVKLTDIFRSISLLVLISTASASGGFPPMQVRLIHFRLSRYFYFSFT